MNCIKIKIPVCLGLLLLALPALAEERRRTLEGQPAVRHRYELRDGRFEVGPSFAFSLDRSMRHAFMIGAKLEYHFSDAFSVGADIGYGVNFNTGLNNEINDGYFFEADNHVDGDPSKALLEPNSKRKCGKNNGKEEECWEHHQSRLSNIKLAGDVRFVWTPIYGRIAVFSKLFVLYDMYVFGGVALAYTANDGDNDDWNYEYTDHEKKKVIQTNDVDAANEGFTAGLALGAGLRVYFNHWFAMGIEVKDLMFMDNETGMDQTQGQSDAELEAYRACRSKGCKLRSWVDGDDKKFTQHWFFGINFTFFFPMEPKVSQ